MSQASKKMLIVSFSEIRSDARVLRQIRYFSSTFDVTVAGFGPRPDVPETVTYLDVQELTHAMQISVFRRLYYAVLFVFGFFKTVTQMNVNVQAVTNAFSKSQWDIVLLNDTSALVTLPLWSTRFGVMTDLHEYAPKQREYSWWRHAIFDRYHHWICKTFLNQAAKITTVSEGLAQEYGKNYGVHVDIVTNATPYYPTLEPGMCGEQIRLVHSGVYEPHRGIDILIQGVKQSSTDIVLDLYLTALNDVSRQSLEALVNNDPRIVIRDPVAYQDLIGTLNQYDVGVFVLPPKQFSFKHALPNKLFDFIQARLGIVIGPSIEMVPYVRNYNLGAVAEDFEVEAFVTELNQLTPAIVNTWKQASHKIASQLSSDQQVKIWGTLTDEMIAGEKCK